MRPTNGGLLAALSNGVPASTTGGWTPTLFLDIDRTKKAPNLARKGAGPYGAFCDSP